MRHAERARVQLTEEEEEAAMDAAEEAAAAAYTALVASTSGPEKFDLGKKFLREGNTDKAVDMLALALEDLSGAQTQQRRSNAPGGFARCSLFSLCSPAV